MFLSSSFPAWNLYLPHSHLLPPQQGVEREKPASEVLISLGLCRTGKNRSCSTAFFPKMSNAATQAAPSSPFFYPKLDFPVALHLFVKGEGKGRGLRAPGGKGSPFSSSQPEIMLQEASCSTASLHTSVRPGIPHPLLSWCFYEMVFPNGSEPSDWRETIK